jgi:iron complex outermembrane receptor protein
MNSLSSALHTLFVCAVAVVSSTAVAQERAQENAVKAAEDAFGVTIGRETLGLYSTTNVRGFSPTAAGNARIDGLYFDQVWTLNSRLRRATLIRVGPSAQSYPFPAPTGIVEHNLKTPGDDASLSVLLAGDEWNTRSIEADAVLPLAADRLSSSVGFALTEEVYHNGTDAVYGNAGGIVRWTPSPPLAVSVFAIRSEVRDDESGPTYVPAGDYLPARVQRGRFDGPSWVDYEGTAENRGITASFTPNDRWQARLGVFHSRFDDRQFYANLLLDLQPDGSARRVIVADPPTRVSSTSGELRATRTLSAESHQQRVHLSVRARDRARLYGGSDSIDLGLARPGVAVLASEPAFAFGPQTHDEVFQHSVGVAYELRFGRRAELGAGIQHVSYEKRFAAPGNAIALTRDEPWLYNIAGAYSLSASLTAYASFTRGLEESGVAPDVASNRGEALPAIITRQADAGIRYAFSSSVKLMAGVFDINKPYFTLDGANRFASLGEVTHRGVELSVSGPVGRGIDVVAGAVAMRPRVSGPDVAAGVVGERPVGQPELTLLCNLNWQPAPQSRFSFDAGARYASRAAATRANTVELPSRVLVDLGARWRFKVANAPAMLRVSIANVTDEYGYELRGSGAYDVIPGRRASAYVAVDW